MSTPSAFENWLRPETHGLHCGPGDFYIDPHAAVERAIITHGHCDHARSGHAAVLATPETIGIMRLGWAKTPAASFRRSLSGKPWRSAA